jgi:hypothetical protein
MSTTAIQTTMVEAVMPAKMTPGPKTVSIMRIMM